MKRFFVVALALLLLASTAFADGMVVRPDGGDWTPYRQSSQRAIINYEDGYENLLIFVKTQGNPQTEKFVWIFPVPSKPEQIEIMNLKGFPTFYGVEQKNQFKSNLMFLAASNFLAAFPPGVILLGLLFIVGSPASMGTYETGAPKATDVGYDIWQHIDRFGIATEVVTAYDSEKFYGFLAARGTNLSPDAKQRIEEYMGTDYSFIVSWISNPEEFRTQGSSYDEPIGVFVRFPTEKMYYPMKMTSVYQDNYIPTAIDVINYRDPEIYANIFRETRIGYHFDDRLQYGLNEEESIRTVFNGRVPEQLRFTRISINAQARYFVQDLWIPDTYSISASAIEAVNAVWLLLAIAIFFALSFAAVFLTNKIVLGSFLNQKRMALLALSNFLTIFGFIVAVLLLRARLSAKERAKFRFLRAMACFWAVFLGIAVLFFVLAVFATAAIK